MSAPSVTVACATCGKSIDPLRAARVRFTENKQWYFCCAAHADEFNFGSENQNAAGPGLVRPMQAGEALEAALLNATPTVALNPSERSAPAEVDTPTEAQTENLGGLLSAPLPHSPLAHDSLPSAPSKPQNSTSPMDVEWLGWAPIVLTMIGAASATLQKASFVEPLATALLLSLSHVWGTRKVTHWLQERETSVERYRSRLRVDGNRVTSTGTVTARAADLRPGEEVIVVAGQFVPADGQVAEGQAQIEMWEGAKQTVAVEEGDRIVAGARVVSGEVRVICSKTNDDRAFSSMTRPHETSIEAHVYASRLSQHITLLIAPFAGAATGWLLYLQTGAWPQALAGFGAVWAALSHPIARALPSVATQRWLFWAARKGICYSHEHLIDQCGGVTVAALCARGTVLHGEPEVAEVHPLRDSDELQLLALAAGAESVVHHPVAAAVLRAARTRNIEVDNCRSHNSAPGQGVVCVSSQGDVLVLGSRELLLRERISIALAEETLRALESRGLTALLLARNNHLIGVLALQDSLRAGAKAAVQVLLDEKVEPILISGDSRATTEAVAHALAIEHVRPEIATAGRAREVKNLIEGGASVAVLGTTPRDDAALGAAPVPVVLDGASISWRDANHGQERAIGLADKSVLTGALSLLAAKRIRSTGRQALALSLLPPAIGAAVTASHLAPLFVPAVLAACGALLAAQGTLKNPASAEGYD